MVKPLLKIQRYFCRKPIRFFSLILLYLTAGCLVFLHSGIMGDSGPGSRGARNSVVASEMASRTPLSHIRGLGIMSRVFKETRKSGRRFGPPWMKKTGQEETEGKRGHYTSNWNRALKGRNAKDMDDGRGQLYGQDTCPPMSTLVQLVSLQHIILTTKCMYSLRKCTEYSHFSKSIIMS